MSGCIFCFESFTHRLHRWDDTLFAPSVAAAISVSLLLLPVILARLKRRISLNEEAPKDESSSRLRHQEQGFLAKSLTYTKQPGGLAISTFKLARLLGSVVLLGFAIADLIKHRVHTQLDGAWWDVFHKDNAPFLSLVATYVRPVPRAVLDNSIIDALLSGIPPSCHL